MEEKIYPTDLGPIHYWTSLKDKTGPSLIFLPGLTADHRLFERQGQFFKDKYNIFLWDPPGHGASWPFELNFSLDHKAGWLKEILDRENIYKPVIIGQSMGGYVGQAFACLYPDSIKGLIAIDSAPLQRSYITWAELFLLKRMEPIYFHFPWKSLLQLGTQGVAESPYGRRLMEEMMMVYEGDKKRYAGLVGHGYRILAEAIEKDLAYPLSCPALLICGEKDRAGSTKRYNKAWHKNTGIPLHWIEGAGHNSNTDKPDLVNKLIDDFVRQII